MIYFIVSLYLIVKEFLIPPTKRIKVHILYEKKNIFMGYFSQWKLIDEIPILDMTQSINIFNGSPPPYT